LDARACPAHPAQQQKAKAEEEEDDDLSPPMRARSSWRLLAARPSPRPVIPRDLHRMTASASTPTHLADAERVAAASAQRAASDGALRGADLLSRLRAVYDTSGACGARIHSQTSVHVQREEGVEFVLRVLPALKAKPQGGGGAGGAAKGGAKPPPPQTNPFLPYDPRLFVSNLSPTHCLLLNKFDVVPLHSLVVTRDFEAQTEPLNARDLGATWAAMAALAAAEASAPSRDGAGGAAAGDDTGALAFYNCGEHSGRSQPHKHVQVVPLPFLGEGEEGDGGDGGAPIGAIVRRALEEAEEEAQKQGSSPAVAELRALPFRAYAARAPPLPTREQEEEGEGGQGAFAALERALDALVARCAADCGAGAPAPSYNLLLTGGWAVAVPRRSERDRPEPHEGEEQEAGGGGGGGGVSVAVNALGFAGTLLCKSAGELDHVRRKGAMRVLADAGWPW
jgi:ATP adenylyltransferase